MGRSAVAITNIAMSTMTAPRINAQICHVFTADHAIAAQRINRPRARHRLDQASSHALESWTTCSIG